MMFAIFGGGAVLGVLLLTSILLTAAWIALENTVHRDEDIISARTAAEIDQYISGKTDTLVGVRELLSYPEENRFKLNLMLRRLATQFSHFSNITLFDASRAVIASSSSMEDISFPEEALAVAGKGNAYRSQVMFTRNNLPYLRIALPIYWQNEVFRILVADLDILAVWNRIDDIKIGDTGRASILSEDGIYIADQDKGRALKRERLEDYISLTAALGPGRGQMDLFSRDGRSIDLSYSEIPSTGWRLLITRDHAESMYYLYRMIAVSILAGGLVLLASYYISAYLSNRISGPVEELYKGMTEISKNNFGYKVPTLPGREMRELSDGFNVMALSLAEMEELRKALESAEKLAAIGRLAADVAHEVNNPLAIMKNYMYILTSRRLDPDDPNIRYIKILDLEINRIARIVLDFNEMSKGVYVPKVDEFDISVPITELVDLCLLDLESNGISLVQNIEDGKLSVSRDKFKQVILNLIKNAKEAMPDGGTIAIGSRIEGDMISISVSDTGTGMPPDVLEKVFAPFFSTKGIVGMGLGLSISYGIVKGFGGEMSIESQLGKGTTLKMTLPLKKETRKEMST